MSSSPPHPPPTSYAALLAIADDETTPPSEAIAMLYQIVHDPSHFDNWETIKKKAIVSLSLLLIQEGRPGEIQDLLLIKAEPFFSSIPCERAVKAFRSIIDAISQVPGGTSDHHQISFHGIPFTVRWSDLQISLYRDIVEWSNAQNRIFIRRHMEESLARLLIDCRKFSEASGLLSGLAEELRRTDDDDLILITVYLLQTKLHLSLEDLPKAKAALTEARELAESLDDMPEYDQAMIDMQSGIYHAEARDYLTADTYFDKACSAFDDLRDPMLIQSLRYTVICKILLNRVDDVALMASDEIRALYQREEFEGMRAVADAWGKRSLKMFVTALKDYKDELQQDPIVRKHLDLLHDALLKDDLRRLIGPDSRVEIAKFAELFELPADKVEKHLSEMIEDKKLAGSLDEVAGYLIIYDDPGTDAASDIIAEMGKVVVSLKRKFRDQ